MPHLEAVTVVTGGSPLVSADTVAPGEYRWRREVPLNVPVRLGRDADKCEFGVPNDGQISRFHATLTWNGTELHVERRGVVFPDHPEETKNFVLYGGNRNDKFAIRVGDSFAIGQTTFRLRPSDETLRAAPVDQTAPLQPVTPKSRAELQDQEFSNRELLRAVYRLPDRLAAVQDEGALLERVLNDVETALPRADAVGIVRRPRHCPPGELEIQVIQQRTRAQPGGTSEFRPSRKLVKKAVCEAECSCLCAWPLGADGPVHLSDMTLSHQPRPGTVPWAVCTPFQDDSQYALYVAGSEEPLGNGLPDPARLRDYQKFAELVVKIAEVALKTIRLQQQLDLALLPWSKNLRPLFNAPAALDALLKEPKECDITVLFCDLRGYSKDAEAKGTNLRAAFAEVQKALDVMSSAVTEKGGIVAGFRGDAILGFWGWPEGTDDQVARATAAAVNIFTKLLGPINQSKCGLGLTHGKALAGRMGAHDFANVDLYGPVVNLAFRLEEMTKAFGTGIVVSDDIATHVRSADPTCARFRTRPLGTVKPRGVNNTLAIHELVPRERIPDYKSWLTENDYSANLKLWKSALDLFTKGQWGEAHAALDDRFHSDPAAKYLMKFMARSNKVPPMSWNGTYEPKPLD